MADPVDNWSADEERLLRHEAFIAEVLEKRKGRAGGSGSPPAWQRFLESAGGAALVTVLFGTLAAGVINSLVQAKLKERELALASYQEELKVRQDIATRIVDLVGTTMGAAEDIIFLTSREFDPANFSGEQSKRIIAQRNRMRDNYNSADGKWRVEPEELGLLVGLHTHDRPDISEAWRGVQRSVTDYKTCAEDWYARFEQAPVSLEQARSACSRQKNAARSSLEKFAQLTESAWETAPPEAGQQPAR